MAGVKSLAKDTAVYGLSSIVGRFLNWMLVPLYTHWLRCRRLRNSNLCVFGGSTRHGGAYLRHGDRFLPLRQP